MGTNANTYFALSQSGLFSLFCIPPNLPPTPSPIPGPCPYQSKETSWSFLPVSSIVRNIRCHYYINCVTLDWQSALRIPFKILLMFGISRYSPEGYEIVSILFIQNQGSQWYRQKLEVRSPVLSALLSKGRPRYTWKNYKCVRLNDRLMTVYTSPSRCSKYNVLWQLLWQLVFYEIKIHRKIFKNIRWWDLPQ